MAVILSSGVTLARLADSPASPVTYNTIGQIASITGLGKVRSDIDVTNLSSALREFRKALPEGSPLVITIQYDPDDAEHGNLLSDVDVDTTRNFKVTFTDSPAQTITFPALVMGFEWNEIAPDTAITAKVTIRPTGSFTVSA